MLSVVIIVILIVWSSVDRWRFEFLHYLDIMPLKVNFVQTMYSVSLSDYTIMYNYVRTWHGLELQRTLLRIIICQLFIVYRWAMVYPLVPPLVHTYVCTYMSSQEAIHACHAHT